MFIAYFALMILNAGLYVETGRKGFLFAVVVFTLGLMVEFIKRWQNV